MDKIKIITDSTYDLPTYIAKKYDIEVLPLLVNFGQESYKDGIDITLHQLLMRIKDGNEFPTTAQVNPQRFLECYKKYIEQGYKIISIHLSSKMSGTYQSACIAKEMLGSEAITVIDSNNVTSGMGLLVMKACKLKEHGKTYEEIVDGVIETIPHVKSILAFETLTNLVKGGRLSKTAGVIGNILGIKPILAVADGEIGVIDKVRGSKKSVRYILDGMENMKVKKGEVTILLHVENRDILDSLRVSLINKDCEFLECEVGCVVGCHAGSGACGVFFIEDY